MTFSKLLYSHTLYVPLNIRYPILRKRCKELNITYEPTSSERRVYTFYGREEDLRALKVEFILKEYVEI